MKAVLFLHVLYLIFIKSFMVKGATKCRSQVLMRAVLLSCPMRENGCEENDILSQTMVAEQEQLLQANGKNFENLKETRTNEFPKAVKDCKRKIVITMKVKNNGKVPCEDKYIVVDHVYDPVTGSRGRLLSPVVLKLRQEQMVQLYGLQFERVVNNEPYEEQISQGKFCSVSPDNPTCGVSMYDGKPIPFSEGFCCSCNNHINAKRQLSSKSHGDSFVYRDSNLISQGHNHFNHEVEPILINPQLVQLRQKKQYDYSKTEQQYLKRLNSEKIPNFLLEKDRKIMCDKGDFMNELCELRKEKLAIEGKKDSDSGVKQELTEKGKPQAPGTLTNVPNTKNRFTARDSMEVFNAEPKTIPGTEFKGSRGKRENRYKMEDNSLEENLERFLRTKKLYRNRRKRLLKISHRRNQSKKIRCNSDECLLPEFPDKDYVKPPPPAYFFSHDKVVLNPMESTKSNISNKSPMESAYNGLKYALEQNRFDTQWNKNARKPIQRYKGNQLKNHVSFDLKNNFQRVNMKKEYLPPDKNIYGKGPTFQMEEAQNEKDEQQGKFPDSYFGVENNENSQIRNYYLSKNKEYMNNNKQSGMFDVKKKQKNEMKDYNEDTKDINESNEINEFRKGLNMREKIRNFKADNQNFEDKTTQEKFEQNNQKFGRTPQGNYPGYFNSKDGGENFDFNVEITHQDFPMAVKPRFSYKNTEYILNRPEIKSSLRKAKLNQMKNNRPPFYFYYNQNFPQDVRIENNPLEFQNPNYNLKDPSWMSPDYDKKEASLDFHKEQPKYFAPALQYLGRNTRPRPFQSKYAHYKMKDEVDYSHDEDSMEEPTKKKVRERRSINEFEPAKGYLASDANSNVAPHEFDICPIETVKKPSEVKPIDINAEILSGLPKLKEKIAKLGDGNNKIHRSLKTDLDRLIQSYLSAPDYVLKEIEAAKEGVKREERNLNEMRNSTCGKSVDGEYTQETAHCMRFGDLWYSMYNIKKPVISQTVGLQLFDKRTLAEGKSKWRDLTKGKMVRIGTFLSSAEDELPSLSLTFTGEDSDSLHSPIDTENYVLLVPSHLSDPSKTNLYPQLEGGPNEYLLVSKKDVSSGEDCNKIGTSFEAFARQRKRCIHYRGSCLKRQAADLWREDMEARIRGKRGKYFVENFGTVPNSPIKTFTNLTGEYLAMEYYGDYSSTIEVELKADHNLIIRKERANAQIPTVYVDGTHPKKTRIFMSVLNTGLTSSSFRPRLGECSPDFDPSWCPLEGSPVTIPPQKRHDFKLDLSGALPANKLHATVQVLNQDNQPIAKRKIRIKRGERCMCAFNCKCNCMGDLEKGKTCRRLDENEYRAAGYLGPPPFRSRSLIAKSFFGSFRLAFLSASYIMLMFGLLKGILGVYFRPLGIVGVRIITGPRKLCHYYEPDLLCCTVLHDELGFPIHPTTCKPVQIVPLYCEVLLNVFFFFLYLIRGFWLILKSSICVKIVFGDCDSSGQDKDSDSKCCRPLLSQQNICMNYNVRTVTSKKCPADEFLPYLRYRGDNDPLEEDDTEFILQEMQKHKKK